MAHHSDACTECRCEVFEPLADYPDTCACGHKHLTAKITLSKIRPATRSYGRGVDNTTTAAVYSTLINGKTYKIHDYTPRRQFEAHKWEVSRVQYVNDVEQDVLISRQFETRKDAVSWLKATVL